MKEAELMGEMITCHGYRNGWSSEDSWRGNCRETVFCCCVEPLQDSSAYLIFFNGVLCEQFNGLTVSGARST